MLDIFNNNAFSVTNLTDAINDLKFKPGRIGELGLFGTEGVDTTTIAVETKGDILTIVPPTPRGAPGTTIGKEKRVMRSLIIPHFEINDAVMAEEVQGIRAFGTSRQLETVIQKVVQRQSLHVNSFGVTEEYARMGAVQGVVVYTDGSTLNLFQEFGVTQDAEINFDLNSASPVDGVLRKQCAAIIRKMSDHLGGVPFAGLHAFCGDDFFDALLQHPEVRETYKGWGDARVLREAYIGANRSSYGIFEFGGIVWENYRGSVGSKTFIDKDKCHLFPTGVPGLFKTAYAPADYINDVNTIGTRLYNKQYRMQNDKGIHLDTQMNALQYCVRPKVLMKGRRA
ncbi:major capsid protein [Paraburkholderia aspalathi]|nr:major capsid protein [Paraburkholderia aspalathi]